MKELLTEEASIKEKLTFDVFYPHAQERVWRALTDPTALKRWLMPTDFRPRLGQKFCFVKPTDSRFDRPIRCEVVELDAPHRLAYTWQSEHDTEPTLVTWTLEPVEGGTRVHLEHTAPALSSTVALRMEARLNWRMTLAESLPVTLRLTAPMRRRGRIALSPIDAPIHCFLQRSDPVPLRARIQTPNTRPALPENAYASHK